MSVKDGLIGKLVLAAVWLLAAISVYLWFGGKMDARGFQVALMGLIILLLCGYLGAGLKQPVIRLALLAVMVAVTAYLYLSAFQVIQMSLDIRLVQACILTVLVVASVIHMIHARSTSQLSGM